MTHTNHLPKLVASDIGGTLIRGGDIVPDFTANVLNRLTAKEIPVVLITGYNHNTTLHFTRNLDENIIRMPQNGTMCLRGKTKIWEHNISEPEAREIYDYLAARSLPIIIYKGDDGQFKNFFQGPPEFKLSDAFERIERLTDFSSITGVSTLVPNDIAGEVREKLKEMTADKFQLIYVREETTSWLEVLQSEVRKDLALKRLCRQLEIPPADVIYFGDNFNDREALRLVGHPVVVDNAVWELKNEIGTTALSVYEEGVALYLNELYDLGL